MAGSMRLPQAFGRHGHPAPPRRRGGELLQSPAVTSEPTPDRSSSHPAVRVVLALAATGLDATLLAIALGGVAPLLAHPRALTLLALWAACAVTLALVRPVRGHDATTVERDPPFVLLALFLLPLLAPPLAALGERLALWPLPGGALLRWLGVALSGAGLGVRIAAMAQLGSRFSPLLAVQRDHALETRGLYARVRHPGYLGALLAALGGALAFGSAVALPLVAAMGLLLWARAGREEALLERHFGLAYLNYRARSGRLLPRLTPQRTPRA